MRIMPDAFPPQQGSAFPEIPGVTFRRCDPSPEGDALTPLVLRVRIAPGAAHPFHAHPGVDEVIHVLEGEMEQWVGGQNKIMRPGESVFIGYGVVHGSYNVGANACELLAVLTPVKPTGPLVVDYSRVEPWASMRQSG